MNRLNLIILTALAFPAELGARVARARRDEQGSVTTEQAIVTAGIVILALAAVAILSAVVLAKVRGIDLDSAPPPTTVP